jgi:hypothetical protein
LAPTVSHALQARAANALLGICSATKSGLDAGLTRKSAPGGLSVPHCPYCTLHAPDLAPAPASCGTVRIAERSVDPSALFLVAPRILHAWASAIPRAPPRHA